MVVLASFSLSAIALAALAGFLLTTPASDPEPQVLAGSESMPELDETYR